ncbi:hypothetical protein SAMN04488057_101180 [Cyclobacterium lianum]|uniref:DUF4157 domain-containing protein n=1 Tax=Cyclobacterium lianum TaxID=388280 RepID=A0A1M7I3W9_9BACT|nr:hypothetical protein [Cyclobacterium lianum]SHM35486.1 hypothetical protein SAMN04488057_101180 [Cyclobacterium lianum]
MKKLSIYPLLLLIIMAACTVEEPNPPQEPEDPENPAPRDPEIEVPFIEGTNIVFTPLEEAAERLGTSDSYTELLSKFDLASRTKNKASTEEEDYLTYASQQAQAWTEEEKTVLEERILGIKDKIEAMGLQLEFPEEILLIKSTMEEEGGAVSYTRENYIVVRGLVNESFLIHELFHILTRFKPEVRKDLFETINFYESNRIAYPESIRDFVITNPDAPFLEHTITLQIDGQSEEVVFILISEEEWDGGSFFTYLKQRLMFVEGGDDDKQATLVDNMPVLKNFAAATDLKQKIGDNTSYTLHPEEILAEHFVMLLQEAEVPEPSYLEAMKTVLQQQ